VASAGASAAAEALGAVEPLPELASVYWRPLVSDARLVRTGRWWTLVTVAHTAPFAGIAVLLGVFKPVTIPVSLVLLAHAWIIPELYAARGANVTRAGRPRPPEPESTALGLLGDLVGHSERELLVRTRLVLERGRLGVWVVGEAGALLIRPGGRRVHCYCVKATDPALPPSDRIAHLLLALRADEAGFATIANLAFSGACWRLGRRLAPQAREALNVARAAART
jgi:hypothetical protein